MNKELEKLRNLAPNVYLVSEDNFNKYVELLGFDEIKKEEIRAGGVCFFRGLPFIKYDKRFNLFFPEPPNIFEQRMNT